MSVFEKPPNRTNPLKTMATDEEKSRIEQAAVRMGLSVAELIRVAVNDYVERHEKRENRRKGG